MRWSRLPPWRAARRRTASPRRDRSSSSFGRLGWSRTAYVTPGQPETISVSRLAPKASLKVFIEPPPITIQCGELYFCDPAPTAPAPGAPPYRSDRKGRALLTFIVPDTYYVEMDPFNPKNRSPVKFADQQRVHIDVDASSRTKHVWRESFGFSRAIVQLAK